MENEPITFLCSSCGIKLSVPRELAGVTGPCPSCGSQIQAPMTSPVQQPTPQASEPAALKPEPMQLPVRSAPPDVVVRPLPEPLPTLARRRVANAPRRRHPYLRHFARFLVLVIFLFASGALVYVVMAVLKRQPEAEQKAPVPIYTRSAEAKPAPPAEAAVPDIEAATMLPDGLEPVSPWKEAEAVLDQFLAAKSLAERLPLMETRTSGGELAASCLAGPLPAVRKLVPELRESNPVAKIIDCYFTVGFETTERPAEAQTILVRTRGTSPPRVVADPFLDTYGGRLAAYAATPTDKNANFQVVVYAVASCTDPNVPEREKKLTLKLLSSDNTREIARAYFGQQSKISEMLEDGNYRLNYGSAKACTVMLRWNTEDYPEHPFLEALAIKDLDWNP